MISRKAKRLVGIYAVAAIVVLSVLSAVLYEHLSELRRAVGYSAGASFETAVSSVSDMSRALHTSLYATDGSMCTKLCSRVCADALAAEAAISVLPFDTYELEQIAGFINTAGDYAYALCCSAATEGFTEKQIEELTAMSQTAAQLAEQLISLQSGVNSGMAVMDKAEKLLANVGVGDTPTVSAELLGYERDFPRAEPLRYDGRYGYDTKRAEGTLDQNAMRETAAKAAGCPAQELREEYSGEGLACYSYGDQSFCVSSRGLESMGRSRLISERVIDMAEAETAAKDFLRSQGFGELQLSRRSDEGWTAAFEFVPLSDGALCIDDKLTVTVALDDGSIYGFNAEGYRGGEGGAEWSISAEEARKKLPESAEELSCARVIIQSDGKQDTPCYEFLCAGADKERLLIYVDADRGVQCRIDEL